MANQKNLLLLFLILILLFIGSDINHIFQTESLKDISFLDFRHSIGPFLTSIAVFLSYKAQIKKEKSTAKQANLTH
ncbi:hypothetical protein B0A67_09755 [Flavobacterium aquidurense]|nr:hypothetical protein B0A67_09755 [Flavobacterium aquidurense]SHH54147.1 hypothetical protein SAMN05444481_11944 [Flavobacterium frigidimaris]